MSSGKGRGKGKARKGKGKARGGGGGGVDLEAAASSSVEHLAFVQSYVPLFVVPPVFAEDRDPEYLYGIVLLANRRLLKRCFQAVVRYLDPQSVMKLRMATKEINMEGERAMYRVWRYLVAVNYSSPFITLPAVGGGGGEGQMSFTRAVYHFFFANKRQEVLIMGGIVGGIEGDPTQEVTKMILEQDGTIRFEASTSLLLARVSHAAVYHQGEVLSFTSDRGEAQGTTERLDTISQTKTMLSDAPLPPLESPSVAILSDRPCTIGGVYILDDGSDVFSDIMYELVEHASQVAQGNWRAHAARLNTARYGAAAAALNGKLYVTGGRDSLNADISSVESLDLSTNTWQFKGYMTKARSGHSLIVYKGELYAVGGDEIDQNTTIEKLNKNTSIWEHVGDCGHNRWLCASVLVGSRIFLFGGNGHTSTFDFFDLESKKWASKTAGMYKKESARQLPRQVEGAKAVLITAPSAKTKDWTDLNVVKLEDRDTLRYNDRFEAVSGKAIAWQWNA